MHIYGYIRSQHRSIHFEASLCPFVQKIRASKLKLPAFNRIFNFMWIECDRPMVQPPLKSASLDWCAPNILARLCASYIYISIDIFYGSFHPNYLIIFVIICIVCIFAKQTTYNTNIYIEPEQSKKFM